QTCALPICRIDCLQRRGDTGGLIVSNDSGSPGIACRAVSVRRINATCPIGVPVVLPARRERCVIQSFARAVRQSYVCQPDSIIPGASRSILFILKPNKIVSRY